MIGVGLGGGGARRDFESHKGPQKRGGGRRDLVRKEKRKTGIENGLLSTHTTNKAISGRGQDGAANMTRLMIRIRGGEGGKGKATRQPQR